MGCLKLGYVESPVSLAYCDQQYLTVLEETTSKSTQIGLLGRVETNYPLSLQISSGFSKQPNYIMHGMSPHPRRLLLLLVVAMGNEPPLCA
jgi:hypothetical protein